MVIKSKQILTATLVVALTAAVAVNWYMKGETPSDTTTQAVSGNLGDSLYVAGTTAASETLTDTTQENPEEYFAEAKLKRTQSDDEIIDSIEDLLGEEDITEELQSKITVMLSDYQREIKTQTDTENLIKAKTNSECLVVINGDTCQVVVQKNTLNEAIILQITEIIEKNTDISAENLTIIELK